jgi:outer membrane protein OmpA-like peptidoglycan-associated protein
MSKSVPRKTIIATSVLVLASCAIGPGHQDNPMVGLKKTFASEDPCSNNARNIGILGGAVLGILLGNAVGGGGTESKLTGAAAGALIGGVIGADMDRRRCELSKIAKKYDLDITLKDVDASGEEKSAGESFKAFAKATATSDSNTYDKALPPVTVMAIREKGGDGMSGHFETGSDQLKPKAKDYFSDIAEQYAKNQIIEDEKDPNKRDELRRNYNLNRRLLLVGHTDDTGSSKFNADLSERRARAVARFLSAKGVPEANIFYQGAGESLPVADNRTEEGRAANRRVELVEASSEAGFDHYLETRKRNFSFYRPTNPSSFKAPDTSFESSDTRKVPNADGGPATYDSTTNVVAKAKADYDNKQSANKQHKGGDLASSTIAGVSDSTKVGGTSAGNKKGINVSANGTQTTLGSTSRGNSANNSTRPTTPPSIDNQVAESKGLEPNPMDGIEFGGGPVVDRKYKSIDIGQTGYASSFGLIKTANADDDVRSVSCDFDRPRLSGDVKYLATGKTYKIGEYLPGAARAAWGAKAGPHFVGLTNVSVLRDGSVPTEKANLMIFKNWTNTPQPDFTSPVDINAYNGEKALLVRAYPVSGPIKCIDLAIEKKNPRQAPNSNLIYVKDGKIFQADYQPVITRY